jgi:hypothetical protein
MFEGTVSVFKTKSVPQIFITNPSKLRIYLMENSYFDHKNVDSVNHQPLSSCKANSFETNLKHFAI